MEGSGHIRRRRFAPLENIGALRQLPPVAGWGRTMGEEAAGMEKEVTQIRRFK